MRTRLAVAALIIVVQPSTANSYEATGWRKAALDLLLNEKQVVDAVWTQDISLRVSMSDNGSNRSGFADYICLILPEAGKAASDFVVVTIYDAATIPSGIWREIGKATCPNG